MTSFTAQELIAHAKAYITADAAVMSQRPAGIPRATWRMENPIAPPIHFKARDTAFKTRPGRSLASGLNGNPYDLWVWNGRKVIERIDLDAADADTRLARYERA